MLDNLDYTLLDVGLKSFDRDTIQNHLLSQYVRTSTNNLPIGNLRYLEEAVTSHAAVRIPASDVYLCHKHIMFSEYSSCPLR